MSFNITLKMAAGVNTKVMLPNFTRNIYMVPKTLTFNQTLDGVTSPAKHIDVNVTTGNASLVFASQSLFDLTNILDLTTRQHYLSEGRDVCVQITNRHRECVDINFSVEYVVDHGNLLFQGSFDTFENVLTEVHSVGHVTRLVFVFNKRQTDVKLLPIFNNDDNVIEWIDGLELGDSEDGNYVLDLCDSNLEGYSKYLNFLRLSVQGNNTDNDLRLSVLAYGYPN